MSTFTRNDADRVIQESISLEKPQSFFLLAGAGSGKTRSLVSALNYAQEHFGDKLIDENRKIAVITYTNAAAEEIRRRSNHFPFFSISTIHSFAWEIIKPFQKNIKDCLVNKLTVDIEDLSSKRGKEIEKNKSTKQDRLNKIYSIQKFVYSPTETISSNASLGHSEVIFILSNFLQRPLFQQILINRFPIILIDECQDTNKNIIECLLTVRKTHDKNFMLGLFGDMMQRIYMDGKDNLATFIDNSWKTPQKNINYRSPKRIVKLINMIRDIDEHKQTPLDESTEGIVRVFLTHSTCIDQFSFEKNACDEMAKITNDELWRGENKEVKILTIEHKMAALRFGFKQLYDALDKSSNIKGKAFNKLSAEDPTPQVKELAFFCNIILPLQKYNAVNNKFGISNIIQKFSPLMKQYAFSENYESHDNHMHHLKNASDALFALWNSGADPVLSDIVSIVAKYKLFDLNNNLRTLVVEDIHNADSKDNPQTSSDVTENNEEQQVWEALGKVPFSMIEKYYSYIKGDSYFDTHQGVKGLQFPRVMVVLDDASAGGKLFSYEKLFGVQPPSVTDKKNIATGKDSTMVSTHRVQKNIDIS